MKKLTENFKDALKIKDLSFELARKLNFKKSLGCVSTVLLLMLIGFQTTQIFAQTCSMVPANLVSWYQGENNTIDFINTNNGTIQGNVTYPTGYVGRTFTLGGAGNNSGSGDRILVGNPANLQLQDFTIEAWVKRSSNTIVTNSPVSGFEGGVFFSYGLNGYGFIIEQATNRIGLTKIGVSAVYSNLTVSDTNFHHVAVTKSGNQVTFYVDGVADTPITYNTTFTFGTNAAIGARGDNDVRNAFFGSIDELSIYNRSLAASEIQAIVAAGSAGKCFMVNTFTVMNTNDSGAGSLRQAILDANASTGADAIEFDAGVFSTPQIITLTSGELLITNSVNSTVIITGPGANLLTVSGNSASRIFTILETPAVAISGMTLTGGNGVGSLGANVGGAVLNQGELTLSNMIITGNTTTAFGGGILTDAGDNLTIVNSTISNNTSGNQGGGIHSGGQITITDSTISGNTTAREGGGMFNAIGPAIISGSTFSNNNVVGPSIIGGGGITFFQINASITNSIISGNTSTGTDGGGGGIRKAGSGTVTISESTITNNSANGGAGGIWMAPSGGSLILTNSTVSNNVANPDLNTAGDGGGIYGDDNTTTTVSNSTISGNQALGSATNAGNGGGIFMDGTFSITNSTVSGNTADRDCGGMLDRNGSGADPFTVSYSTIVNNTAGRNVGGFCTLDTANSIGGVIFANNTAVSSGSDLGVATYNSLGYNLIEGLSGATITGDTATNIIGVDPLLENLANYGGSTQTHRPMANSPVIDAGDTGNFPATDQRGVMRPIDGNPGNFVAQPDIGAFEFAAPTAANVTVSGRVSNGISGIRNAVVTINDFQGNIRSVRTNAFGYFRFVEVEAGQTYIVNVFSKQYQFAPQVVSINGEIADLEFTPQF